MPRGVTRDTLGIGPDVAFDSLVAKNFHSFFMPMTMGAAEGLELSNVRVALVACELFMDQNPRIGVIQFCRKPTVVVVAELTLLRETVGGVGRILGFDVVGLMATITSVLERRMPESSSAPGASQMTPLTVLDPSQSEVIWILNDGQVGLVTTLTTRVFQREVALLGSFMTAPAWCRQVGTREWEARSLMFGYLTLGLPILLSMAILARVAQEPVVYVRVAAATTLSCENLDRPAIIVTA